MLMKKVKIRYQKPVKGGRKSLPACVISKIKERIEAIAWKHRVSKSFVINTLLADKLNIHIEEHYYD